jgi:hypothetical protein
MLIFLGLERFMVVDGSFCSSVFISTFDKSMFFVKRKSALGSAGSGVFLSNFGDFGDLGDFGDFGDLGLFGFGMQRPGDGAVPFIMCRL